MNGHERFQYPLPHPGPLRMLGSSISEPDNSKGSPARIPMDDYGYQPEVSHSSSTDGSQEDRNDLLASSDMRDFSSCFTTRVPPISSPSMSCYIPAAPDQRLFDSEGAHVECNGAHAECNRAPEDDGRKEREHKKRSKNWTRVETLKLIKERTEIDAKFARMGRKTELWEAIAEALQRASFIRDGQQCKDKWEKLSAGYKEVREGIREKEQFPYFDELHLLAFDRLKRRERDNEHGRPGRQEAGCIDELDLSGQLACTMAAYADVPPQQVLPCSKSKEATPTPIAAIDLSAVQELMEMILSKQQKFFVDFLDAMEKRDQAKEQMRQEREERWRAEERAQRRVLNNAMVLLAQRLLDVRSGPGVSAWAAAGDENTSEMAGRVKKKPKFYKQ